MLSKEEGNAEDDDYRAQSESYYTIAHSIKEEVTEQAKMMVYGSLKSYQVYCDLSIP